MALYLYRTKGKNLRHMKKASIIKATTKRLRPCELYRGVSIGNPEGLPSCATCAHSSAMPDGMAGDEHNVWCRHPKCPSEDRGVRRGFYCHHCKPDNLTRKCVRNMYRKDFGHV